MAEQHQAAAGGGWPFIQSGSCRHGWMFSSSHVQLLELRLREGEEDSR